MQTRMAKSLTMESFPSLEHNSPLQVASVHDLPTIMIRGNHGSIEHRQADFWAKGHRKGDKRACSTGERPRRSIVIGSSRPGREPRCCSLSSLRERTFCWSQHRLRWRRPPVVHSGDQSLLFLTGTCQRFGSSAALHAGIVTIPIPNALPLDLRIPADSSLALDYHDPREEVSQLSN